MFSRHSSFKTPGRTAARLITWTLATATLSLAQSLPAPSPSDDPVELDRFEVRAAQQRLFSLPLDAAADTGSRLELSGRELPASISVVTQELIQLRGLRTAVEAVEAAVGMTGGTQWGSIPGYATRGFTGNSVTILRDGIRQNTASQASRTVDAFNLDRVEVLKGPASLMFGEGAVGGAVNYVSKAPDRRARGEAFASYGTWDYWRFGLGQGGPVIPDRVFYRLDLSHTDRRGYVEDVRHRYTGLSGALGWDATDTLRLTWFSTYLTDWNTSYYGNPVIYDAVDRSDPATGAITRLVTTANPATDRLVNPRVDSAARRTNYNITDNYAETENTFNRLRAEWKPGPDWTVRHESYVATQLLKWRNLETNRWNPVTQLVNRTSFALIYRDDVLLGHRLDATHRGTLFGRPNRLLVGASHERNDLTRGGAPTGTPSALSAVTLLKPDVGIGPGDPKRFQKNARTVVSTQALFVENSFDAGDSLKLIAGLRYDDIGLARTALVTPANPTRSLYEKNYHPTTGRAGAVWSVSRDLNLYASASYAAEPVTQLVSFNVAQDNFSLQKGRQYEVGAKGTLPDARVDFTVALYDIEKNDLVSSTLDPVTGERLRQQIGAQVSQGAELAVAWSPTRDWRIEGNLAWTWRAAFRDFNENLGTGVISRSGNRPANVADVIASLHVSRTFGAWRFGAGARYVSERPANNANLIWTPAYTTVDAAVAYTRDRWTLTLRGRNLLDATYEEWATSAGLMQRLADPRSIELSVRHVW